MQSNRELTRRSRMKIQQPMKYLSNQIERLKKENIQVSANMWVTTEMYLNVESENVILRLKTAQHMFLYCPCFDSLWSLARSWFVTSTTDMSHLHEHAT